MKIGQSLITVTPQKAIDNFNVNDLVINHGELRRMVGMYSVVLECNRSRPIHLEVSLVKILMPEFIERGVGIFWVKDGIQRGEVCLLSDINGKRELRNKLKLLTKYEKRSINLW